MTLTEIVYLSIGVLAIWLGGLLASAYVIEYLITEILNILGRIYKPLWQIYDYHANKEAFKYWQESEKFNVSSTSSKYDFLVEYEKHNCGLDYEKSLESIEEFLNETNL